MSEQVQVDGGAVPAEHLDVLIVGAGFSGLYAIHRFHRQGLKLLCLEAAGGVGGVWHHNRYPGARCDVRSIDYSYSFSPDLQEEWRWTERFASQPEILRYAEHVAERFDLLRHIRFDTRLVSARWDDDNSRWLAQSDTGERYACRHLVLATGALSAPKEPDFAGLDDFAGERLQTSRWPHHPISFSGKRVGVIGTGSSGIQTIPVVAKEAAHLTVFQRTPAFSMPARNGPIDEAEYSEIRARYPEYRQEMRDGHSGQFAAGSGRPARDFTHEEQQAALEAGWARGGLGLGGAFSDSLTDQDANDIVARFIHDKIRSIVKDPAVAEKLCPTDHPVSTRRPCLDTGYFETFNRDNVTLVDLREDPIERVTARGIRTKSGEHLLDTIIFATGFDAFTGAVRAIDIRNGAGEHVLDRWKGGPRTYLGTMVSGFPNLFFVTGPGSPSVLANVIIAAELDIEWISDCIAWLDANGRRTIEPLAEAEQQWVEHVAEVASRTLYPKANSWYMGANIPGKPRVFLPYVGGLGNFARIARAKAAAGYEGYSVR
jgi:cyclohexanone monooxygenase